MLTLHSLKAPAPLTRSKAAAGRRAGVQEPFSPPPLKESDAWMGSSCNFCAHYAGTHLWRITATQTEAGNTQLLQKDTHTEQEQLQEKAK